jgi:hypothetical protein
MEHRGLPGVAQRGFAGVNQRDVWSLGFLRRP